jgi:hypothetical protein
MINNRQYNNHKILKNRLKIVSLAILLKVRCLFNNKILLRKACRFMGLIKKFN